MPLLWLSLAFLSGILLSAQFSLHTFAWLGLAATSFLLFILPRLYPHLASLPSVFLQHPLFLRLERSLTQIKGALPLPPVTLLLFALFIGAARYQVSQPAITPSFIAWYNDLKSESIVEGTLVELPDERDQYTNLRVKVDRLRPTSNLLFTQVNGIVLARVPSGGNWRYGDRLRLQGILETPPEWEAFSYRDYLAHQGVYSMMNPAEPSLLMHDQGNALLSAIHALRQQALGMVYRLFPDPEASLLAGILLGMQSGIPQDVQEAFQATGTSHIIAISGFNITIISAFLFIVFGRLLGKRRGAFTAALGITFYTVFVGASAAVVRAAIFGALALFGRQVGRRQHSLNSLMIVAAVMAFFSPHVLWDIGFQLSFAATLGLMLYADPLRRAFISVTSRYLPEPTVKRLADPVGAYFLFTLAALLTTFPLTLAYFGYLPLTALIANPLILPAQPAVMILGGLATLAGMIFLPLGQALAYLAWPFVGYTIRTIEWIASLPAGVWTFGGGSLPLAILYYTVLFTLTIAQVRLASTGQKFSGLPFLKPGALLLALAVLTVLTWRAAFTAPDGRLHLSVLNVGSGEGIFIQTPAGRYILINGGPSTSLPSEALGRRLPLTHRRLDWLVIASPDEEGVAALPRLLERYPTDNVLWAGPTHGTLSSRQLWEALTLTGTPVTLMQPGHTLDLGDEASLKALTVSGRGAVLLLKYRNFQALLPMGLTLDDLESLDYGKSIGSVTILVLAESGYAPLNPPGWISTLQPQLALLSVAADDRQGLPDAETLLALQGIPLLRTDRNGWIEITTDGEKMWVEVERK